MWTPKPEVSPDAPSGVTLQADAYVLLKLEQDMGFTLGVARWFAFVLMHYTPPFDTHPWLLLDYHELHA